VLDAHAKRGPVPTISDETLKEESGQAFAILEPSFRAESSKVRHFALTMAWRVGRLTEKSDVRRRTVDALVAACGDPEALVWQHAAKHLLSFRANDFSDDARAALAKLARGDSPHPDILRAVGVAEIETLTPHLSSLLIDESKYESGPHAGRWYGTASWAARLARARMGDDAATERVVELVKAEPDIIVRAGVLFHDLAYVGRPETLSVLSEALASEARLPSSKGGLNGPAEAQYALEALAQHVHGFPIDARGPGSYRDVEVAQAQKWLAKRPANRSAR